MDNKIKHYSPTQSIPNAEFLPLLRGEAPYYGNLNRPAQSAFSLADTVAEIQSWGGMISILQQQDQTHTFHLYEIAKISNTELLEVATSTDPVYTRYGIVVAEAEFDPISLFSKNIVVCTFCPNFVYPTTPNAWTTTNSNSHLYLTIPTTDNTYLSTTRTNSTPNPIYITDMALAIKTGPRSIFFSGTARLFGV